MDSVERRMTRVRMQVVDLDYEGQKMDLTPAVGA